MNTNPKNPGRKRKQSFDSMKNDTPAVIKGLNTTRVGVAPKPVPPPPLVPCNVATHTIGNSSEPSSSPLTIDTSKETKAKKYNNNDAVKRCRAKQKEKLQKQLEEQEKLKTETAALTTKVDRLRKEIIFLRSMYAEHLKKNHDLVLEGDTSVCKNDVIGMNALQVSDDEKRKEGEIKKQDDEIFKKPQINGFVPRKVTGTPVTLYTLPSPEPLVCTPDITSIVPKIIYVMVPGNPLHHSKSVLHQLNDMSVISLNNGANDGASK